MRMSPNKEDYLKAIFNLNGAFEKVTNKNIAKELAVSAASVTEMNNRLVKEDLITYFPYRGVQLTKAGIRTANQLIRKHRLWEVFLYEKLNYKWDEVHDEADRLEHASSSEVIERLSDFLGNPHYDPHGGIIPNADGTVDEAIVPLLSLNEAETGLYFVVKEVVDDEDLLNYLFEKNFALNKAYKLIKKDAYDGTVIVLDNELDKEISISGKATQQIKVKQLNND